MKTLLLLLIIIPSVLFSQSLVFTDNSANTYPYLTAHEILSGGQQIAILQSYNEITDDLNTVLKFNSNGTVSNQFSFSIGESQFDGLIGVLPMENDEYIIAFENYYGNFYLIRFAADNSIVWKKNYTIPNYYQYFKHQIIQDGNGGIYMMISNFENLTLLKINSTGNIEWSKAYIGPESGGKSPGFSICRTSDNGVIGTLKDGSNQCVFKVNDLGTVQWSKSFMDMNYRWPMSVRETNDGNYIVAGRLNDNIPYLHKITPSGEFLFAKVFESPNNDIRFYDAKQHSNGKFYLLVTEYYNQGLMEVDPSGNLMITTLIDETGASDYLYPKFNNNESDLSTYLIRVEDGIHTRIDFNGDFNAHCNSYQIDQITSSDDDLITQAIINTDLYVNSTTITVGENVIVEALTGYNVTALDFCDYQLDLDETAQQNLEIYPNPSTDQININADGGIISQIELFDLQGKCVLKHDPVLTEVQKIDISNLSSGIYRLVMIVNGNVKNEQVIIH